MSQGRVLLRVAFLLHDCMPPNEVSGFGANFASLFDLSVFRPSRIKHWRKHGGAPPEGVGAAVGQAAAILRKANERRRGGFGGRFGGRGFGRGRGDYGGGGFGRGGGGRGGGGRGGGGPRTPYGPPPGQYGPR